MCLGISNENWYDIGPLSPLYFFHNIKDGIDRFANFTSLQPYHHNHKKDIIYTVLGSSFLCLTASVVIFPHINVEILYRSIVSFHVTSYFLCASDKASNSGVESLGIQTFY